MAAPDLASVPPHAALTMTDASYTRFCQFLERSSGITLGAGKAYLVKSRIGRVLEEFALDGLGALVDELEQGASAALRTRVIDAMTTNETQWFRDQYPFDILKETLLPALSRQRAGPVRIWSAASSTGQEAYSISMIVSEYLATSPGALPAGVEILGTDISPSVVRQAGSGLYDGIDLARGLSEERRARFFARAGERLQVRDEVRRRVAFRELNLLGSFSALGRFDIVFCRNVLIYFTHEIKCDILKRVARVITPGGHLFLGGSEPLANYSDEFEMLRHARGVVYRLKR